MGSDKELSERVAKLEKLLKKVANERGSEEQRYPTPTPPVANIEPSPVQGKQEVVAEPGTVEADAWQDQNELVPTNVPRPGTAYMGVSFWEDIMQQVRLQFVCSISLVV